MFPRLRTAMIAVGIMLIATPCVAHSIHPVFIGLGPIPVLAALRSIVGCLPLAALIAAEALLLHRVLPGKTYSGALWRAAVIFVLSKVAETLPIFLGEDVVMGSCSTSRLVGIALLMCLAAVLANALLIRLLFGHARPKLLTTVWLALALEAASLGVQFVIVAGLCAIGIVR